MKTVFYLLLLASTSALRTLSRIQVPSPSFIREAEIKHGRVAMTSVVALSMLSGQGFDHPSTVLSQCSSTDQVMFFSAIGILEALVYFPRLNYRFSLKKNIEVGKILDSLPEPDPNIVFLEDIWGRLAMLGVASFMVADSIIV